MKSKILLDDEAREALKIGVDSVTNVVKRTAGAAGRLTLVDHMSFNQPNSTKDGYISGNSIFLEDETHQAGVRLVKGACENTVDSTGDGSTATAVLIQSIVDRGIGAIEDGNNINLVTQGIMHFKDDVIQLLNDRSKPVSYGSKELLNVATISANNDGKIGKLVSDAITRAGKYGRVNVEESNSIYTTVEQKDGFVLDGGLMSSHFVNNSKKWTNELSNPIILVTNHVVENLKDVVHLYEVSASTGRPLLIIGQAIQGELLATSIVNFVQGKIKINCVELPSYGSNSLAILSDIAASVGATFISLESGIPLQEVTMDMLGTCEKSITDKVETRLIGGRSDVETIKLVVSDINAQLEDTELDVNERKFLEDRLASLSNGITTIYVGAQTKVEAVEMKDRIDDCLGSCKVSISSGASIGGGVALYNACMMCSPPKHNKFGDDFLLGADILLFAIREPAINILINAGLERDEAVNELDELESWDDEIYDVLTYSRKNAYDSGIVDATKVVTLALDNAVSTAITILKTSSLVVNVDGK